MEEKEIHYECDECGSAWTIHHDNYDDVQYCPFCGFDLFEYDEDLLDEDPDLEYDAQCMTTPGDLTGKFLILRIQTNIKGLSIVL